MLSAHLQTEFSTVGHLDLATQLCQNGFARVRLIDKSKLAILQSQLALIQQTSTFRFPPEEGPVIYDSNKRDCFRILFHVARGCLSLLLPVETDEHVKRLRQKLNRSVEQKLFHNPNAPFSQEQSFSGSFFNLFHYDHGCLNTHRDRYLITVIAVLPPADGVNRSALWVKSPLRGWQNADQIVAADELLVFVGEEMAQLSTTWPSPLPAVEHCIRVDPNGERIPHSHHRRDPMTPQTGNRCSIALVLGE